MKYAQEIPSNQMQKFNHEQIIKSCLLRWQQEDDRTKFFSNVFNSWVSSIPETAIAMIFHLLSCFCYYPHKVVNQYLVELHNKLISNGEINDDNTVYTSIKSNTGIGNSSNDYLVEYKLLNNINKYTWFDDIRKIKPKQQAYILNVILIDDCSGSGSTLIKYLGNNLDFFRGKNIYFITIHIMKEALVNISRYAQEQNLNIYVIFAIDQDKAFNNTFFHNNQSLKEHFIAISKSLEIHDNYILGYDKSEGLFAFYNNTPNNTLGIFWQDTSRIRSIFPRKNDKKPIWMTLMEQKDNRKKQNYRSVSGWHR